MSKCHYVVDCCSSTSIRRHSLISVLGARPLSLSVAACAMDGVDTLRQNKTKLGNILCADYGLILNKVDESGLITRRDYTNLKSISGSDAWGHVVELVDKILNKGEATCKAFLDLLHTDDDIKSAYPELGKLSWKATFVPKPVQECSINICGQ